jgi:hypothetical protein
VPHVDRTLARAILAGGPYVAIDDLQRVPGMTPPALAAFREMRQAMTAPPEPGTAEEGSLSIKAIVLPYVWRALRVWLACAVLGAVFYRGARRVSWWRLGLNGLAASLAALLAGWTIDNGTGVLALAVPIAVCGVPAALLAAWRTRSPRRAALALGAWAAASLPAALAVVPL